MDLWWVSGGFMVVLVGFWWNFWRLAWILRMCFLLFREEHNGFAHVFLGFILSEQVNSYVFPHKDQMYVLKMCFHICTHGAQTSRHSGCVSTKTWERACVYSWKHQNGKGTRLCFQLSSPSCLETRMCEKCVFCVSSRLKSVAVFLAQAHPNRCFCQKLFTCRDQKPRNYMQREKRNLPESHDKLRITLQKLAQKTHTRYNLTYKTYNQT